MPSIEYKISVFVFLLLCFFFCSFFSDNLGMQVEADFFATCLYLPASLGTTAFVLPCVADADPISFPELDLSENESKTLQLCIL